mmetsp:Transcript_7330/g.10774  ORF Transcript_7330/g.10774 Transcript_7330/m.10774 type:complete len:191 (+) Transcript_7330:108-680(+)
MRRMLAKWLADFQSVVDNIVGGDYLQFATELWYPEAIGDPYLEGEEEDGEEVAEKIWKRVKVLEDESFPFLDMEMRWKLGKFFFKVYHKKNQQLKCVDCLSMRRQSTFKSITKGVLTRLGRLTSRAKELDLLRVDPIYLDHAKALLITDVALVFFSTFGEIWKKEDEVSTNQEEGQTNYLFCCGIQQFHP